MKNDKNPQHGNLESEPNTQMQPLSFFISRKFLPIKAPPGWTKAEDIEYYESNWGDPSDYGNDVDLILVTNVERLQLLLDDAIVYFATQRGFARRIPSLATTLLD